MNAVLAIAGADAAERTRRFAFLLTIVAALYGGYLYVPDLSANYITVSVEGHRGLYSSAWMGLMMAVMSSANLTLLGFYLVRGSLARDRELDVDGIVAASPVRKLPFLLGKWLSNLGVLFCIATVMFGAAIVMQLLRGEDRHIELLAYLIPLIVLVLPAVALVSATAILFDSIKFLRGIIGAVAYLFLWTAMFAIPLTLTHGDGVTLADPFGITPAMAAMTAAVHQAVPLAKGHDITIGVELIPRGGIKTFAFDGMRWTAAILAERAVWLIASLLIVCLAIPSFKRFENQEDVKTDRFRRTIDLTRAVPNVLGLRLYRAELGLLLNGSNPWWLLGAVALVVLCAVLPMTYVLKYVLPLALIWPLERWSALGSREKRWNVAEILCASPHPVLRSVAAQWAASNTVGTLLCAGYVVRLIIIGDWFAAGATVLTIGAISAAALACGVLSGTPRLFECTYLLLWYIGPINHLPAFDFASDTFVAPATASIAAAIVASVGLAGALFGRKMAYSR